MRAVTLASVLAGAALVAVAYGASDHVWAARFSDLAPGSAVKSWSVHAFPKIARHTRFSLVRDDDATVLKADSDSAASGLVTRVDVDPARHPYLEWRWRVDDVIASARWGEKGADDFAARLFVIFESDGGAFSFFGHWMKKMAGGFAGKALSYVWSNEAAPGTIAPSPYTKSVAVVSVESGTDKIGTWVTERRDIRDDFEKSFGKKPPRVVAIAVMVDTDDTKSRATTYYGDIRFVAAAKRNALPAR